MQPTVKSLRLGSKLLFGRYGVKADMEPQPITWLKATPNCDLVSESVVDFLCFDAKERYPVENRAWPEVRPNDCWHLSNIFQYLNSEEDNWFHKLHEQDVAPARGYSDVDSPEAVYSAHYGFLRYFEDFELANLLDQTYIINDLECTSKMRLLSVADVTGDTRFNVFRKRGIRAHPTVDIQRYKYNAPGSSTEQFMGFFLMDKPNRAGWSSYVQAVGRNGSVYAEYASHGLGIRPTCRIKPDTKVEEVGDGVYDVVPFDVHPIPVGTDEEIMMLLGLV